jgi:hypothetical protein
LNIKQQYLTNFHAFQQNREKSFAPKIFSALRLQYQQFIKSKGDLMAITSFGVYTTLKALYLDAGVNYGSLVYAGLPKKPVKRRAPIGFNQMMRDLINVYFEGDILNTSEGITDTTRNLIRVVMQIANEEGRGFDWITDQLVKESYDLTRNRSRLIARTETVTSANQAAYFAAAKNGLMMKKEWLSAMDNRVRTDHELVNGSVIDMEDFFTIGGTKMLLPGAKTQQNGLPSLAKEVCNCRCTVLYLPQRDASGRVVEYDYGLWPQLVS